MEGGILILDFGSQYTQLIARRVRELGVFSEIRPYDAPLEEIRRCGPAGIILSGGPASVTAARAPLVSPALFELGIPILGICYGMQLLTRLHGGRIGRSTQREYGRAELRIGKRSSPLFTNVRGNSVVWMSHGDSVLELAPGFAASARTADGTLAAMEDRRRRFYAVQFHPEVIHSAEGKKILKNFVIGIAGAARNWSMKNFVAHEIASLRERCAGKKVVLGVSGGVDSTTLAVLAQKALGRNVTAIFVDNGLLRLNEVEEVRRSLRRLRLRVTCIDASARFLKNLRGVSHPEKKRKIIGKTFIDVFYRGLRDFDFLVQGTLYPDVIESNPVQGPSQTIKTHHNRVAEVRRLERQGRIVEPFRFLFKDEVRQVAKLLGIPSDIRDRHPFPGPGLAVRILGDVTRRRLDILRRADDIFIAELKRSGWYDKVWQAFAVFLPLKSVGVMGDERAYGNIIALRAITSLDGMTANWVHLPAAVLEGAAAQIVRRIREVNRVVYDVTSKPPATIEWE